MYKRLTFLLGMALLATIAISQSAHAQTKNSNLALELGNVLASEEACGLTYDQAAIERFIDKRVPADDMGFPSMLSLMTAGSGARIERMTASSKTAHCAQIRRIAKTFGFIGG